MNPAYPSPDRDRLSIVAALVLLSYGLIRIVVIPTTSIEISILGLLVRLEINTRLVMLTLAAAVTVSGTDWVIHSHPACEPGTSTTDHWIVPGLASLAMGAILVRLPQGPVFWIGLTLAAALLLSVLVAEFIVSDPSDPRSGMAGLGLRSLAHLLLIGTFFAVMAVDLRAVFAVPFVLLSSMAVSWRLLRLETIHPTPWLYAALIGLITAQVAWALHYWPVSPVKASLILGLIVYLGEAFLREYLGEGLDRNRGLEFSVIGLITLILILIFT